MILKINVMLNRYPSTEVFMSVSNQVSEIKYFGFTAFRHAKFQQTVSASAHED